MRTWDIAKILIERCRSPEDVDQAIMVLRNPETAREVCTFLTSFSNKEKFISQDRTETATSQYKSNVDPSPSAAKTNAGTKRSTHLVTSSRRAIAIHLETLFRASGMTNRQVEQWVTTNFPISITVNKSSLLDYLIRVLNRSDLGMTNRIFAAAQRLANDKSVSTSDISNYWDGLDKHFVSSHE